MDAHPALSVSLDLTDRVVESASEHATALSAASWKIPAWWACAWVTTGAWWSVHRTTWHDMGNLPIRRNWRSTTACPWAAPDKPEAGCSPRRQGGGASC